MNDTSFSQLASALESLGIDGITDELVSRLEQSWSGIAEEIRAELDMPSTLRTELGSGTYNNGSGVWSPSSSAVYAFDMEVFAPDTMYTDFLRGVSVLGGGELDFTDIEENLDHVDWESGSGTRSVTFSWRGARHNRDAQMMHDWFDLRFADSLNALIAANCGGKQLYFGSDGYQELFVFYCDAQWAAAFEAATGMELTAKLR